MVWGNIDSISANFSIFDKIKVKVVDYKEEHNSIKYSRKRALLHQFAEFKDVFDNSDFVEGTITDNYTTIATVEIKYKGLIVQGFIHKSKISNCCYILDNDIPTYLPIGKTFSFIVDKIDDRHSIIHMSRKKYLEEVKKIELGKSYLVYYTKSDRSKSFFYSNNLECYIRGEKDLATGKEIEVIPVNTSSDEFIIGE